jgi:transcriptional regulator with XRE-family HTH domain
MIDKSNKEIFSNNLKFFMQQKNKTRKEICDDLNIKYTTFADWYNGNKYPRIDKIELLAKYFGIQKSDLIEEKNDTNKNSLELTARDERDIKKHLDKALENLENDEALMFDGEPVEMDEETKELLKASLENSIRLAKTLAKKKYTPKKYQKNDKSDD